MPAIEYTDLKLLFEHILEHVLIDHLVDIQQAIVELPAEDVELALLLALEDLLSP